MSHNFDQIINRQNTNSTKWQKYPADVLPFWVADMDFAAPEFILAPLRERLLHPILGYTDRPDRLTESFIAWLEHHFAWQINPEYVVWLPGVVPALNVAARTLPADSGLLLPTPVYHPFLDVAANSSLQEIRVPMANSSGRWHMDLDAMQQAVTPQTRMLMICNPQNPTGRCYTRGELEQLGEFCERNDLLLVSDDIHANIILDRDRQHLPFAAVCPELAARSITLFAATKTYNIPGLSCAAAVIPDPKLRQRFLAARAGIMPGVGPLEYIASQHAFDDRSSWVPDLLDYLRGNLAMVKATAGERMAHLEATYLAWLDVGDLGLGADTDKHFVSHGLGLSAGAQFGEPDFVRFNFACPRETLAQGLERLAAALNQSPV